MSENAIDSENISKPAPDTAKSKGTRKAGKKAKAVKKPGQHRPEVQELPADRPIRSTLDRFST